MNNSSYFRFDDDDKTKYISYAGLILGLRPANERRSYKVALSPIGWAQT